MSSGEVTAWRRAGLRSTSQDACSRPLDTSCLYPYSITSEPADSQKSNSTNRKLWTSDPHNSDARPHADGKIVIRNTPCNILDGIWHIAHSRRTTRVYALLTLSQNGRSDVGIALARLSYRVRVPEQDSTIVTDCSECRCAKPFGCSSIMRWRIATPGEAVNVLLVTRQLGQPESWVSDVDQAN